MGLLSKILIIETWSPIEAVTKFVLNNISWTPEVFQKNFSIILQRYPKSTPNGGISPKIETLSHIVVVVVVTEGILYQEESLSPPPDNRINEAMTTISADSEGRRRGFERRMSWLSLLRRMRRNSRRMA